MKTSIDKNDELTAYLNDGRIIGGTLLGSDSNGLVIKTGPAPKDLKAVEKSSIKSLAIIREIIHDVSITDMIFEEDYCGYQSESYKPIEANQGTHSRPSYWSENMKSWYHPIKGDCSCSPTCTGGWSKSAVGIN